MYPAIEAGSSISQKEIGWNAKYFKAPDVSSNPFFTKSFPRGSMMTVMDLDVIWLQVPSFRNDVHSRENGTPLFQLWKYGSREDLRQQ
jgi:hypothetical protein